MPALLILDDLVLHQFTVQEFADLFELILHLHRISSFVITSNREGECLGLFDGPILGNSLLKLLANASSPDRHRGKQLPGTAVATSRSAGRRLGRR